MRRSRALMCHAPTIRRPRSRQSFLREPEEVKTLGIGRPGVIPEHCPGEGRLPESVGIIGVMTANEWSVGSRDSGRDAALGCRAHTGWAALVVVAGGFARPEVLLRGRAELGDPNGRVRRNVYQASRALEPAAAAARVEAAERIAAEQAAAALERTVRDVTG